MLDYATVYDAAINQKRAASQDYNAFNERTLDRMIAQNEAQRQRQHQFNLQDNETFGRRQLANDQYGYQYALADQGLGNDLVRDNYRYMHDDELWNKQQAGRIAEQQLQNLQAQQMSMLQAGQQENRDYRLQGFNQENTAQQQDYQIGRDQFQADQMENRDYRLQGFNQENTTQQQGFDASKTMFDADRRQQEQFSTQAHALNLQNMIQEGRLAEEAYQNKYRLGELSVSHQYRAQEQENERRVKEIQDRMQGIAKGDYDISDSDWQSLTQDIPNARSKILNSGTLTEQQQKDALEQLDAKEASIYLHSRPTPEWKKNSTEDARLEKYRAGLPEEERPYLVLGKDSSPQFIRGSKPGAPKIPTGPITPDEQAYLDQNYPELAGKDGHVKPSRAKDGSPAPDYKAITTIQNIQNPKPTFYETMAAIDERQAKAARAAEERQIQRIDNQNKTQKEQQDFDVFQQALKEIDKTFEPKRIPKPKDQQTGIMSYFSTLDREPTADEVLQQKYQKLQESVPPGNVYLKRFISGMQEEYSGNQGATQPSTVRKRSPDGKYEWDGKQWISTGSK